MFSKENYQSIDLLPERKKSKFTSDIKKVVLESNNFEITFPVFEYLYMFVFRIIPPIESKQEQSKFIRENSKTIETFIPQPVYLDNYIFTKKDPLQKNINIECGNKFLIVKQITKYAMKQNRIEYLRFIRGLVNKIMKSIGFKEMGYGRKLINTTKKLSYENYNIYDGFQLFYYRKDGKYFMKVDSVMKIVREDTVLKFIRKFYLQNQHLDKYEKRQLLKNTLIGKTVLTNYGSLRYFIIQDIIFQELENVVVESERETLEQYYKSKYDLTITDKKQPLILTNSKKISIKTYLIPQFCLMTGIDSQLESEKRIKIAKICERPVFQRKQLISKFVKNIYENDKQNAIEKLDIKFQYTPSSLEANEFTQPKIQLGSGKFVHPNKEASFNIEKFPIFKNNIRVKLAIIQLESSDSKEILNYFQKLVPNLNVQLESCTISINVKDSRQILSTLEGWIDRLILKEECNIFLILLPKKLQNKYQAIKQLFVLKKNVVSQIVMEHSLRNKNKSIISKKLLFQILTKIGNVLWSSCPKVLGKGIMLVGFHNCYLEKANMNCIGICASTDDNMTQNYNKVISFNQKDKVFEKMLILMMNAVCNYKKINKKLPEQIIILEKPSFFEKVGNIKEKFIFPLEDQLKKEFKGLPSITFIFVKNNKNSRLFSKRNNEYMNPSIGTWVNIEESENNEFILVTHSAKARKGCLDLYSYETRYTSSKLKSGKIEQILFNQCYNFANWEGSIKLPNVLHYAEKCAKFNGEVLRSKEVNENMENSLYYI